MEVKINREIRNYTESMFFGLSLRQFFFLFSLVALRRTVFLAQTVCWHGNRIVGVHFGCCPVCGTWFCEVQRYDRRESNLCVDKIGVFNAEEVGIHSTNVYYELMKPSIEQKQKEVLKSND